MDYGDAQYLPVAPPVFFLLAGLVGLLLVLVQLRILQFVYEQLGVSSGAAVLLLLASLLGGYVNIPLATLGAEPVLDAREIYYYGVPYVVPRLSGAPPVLLAVNVGGAIIPAALSFYLLSHNALWGRGALAMAGVAAVAYAYAEPVRGLGVALPIFVAPLAATVIAALISWRDGWRSFAPLAYAGGSMGVLVGADLLNFPWLRGIGAPVLSIGGAGTFDGIFMTGVLSVLLASLIGGRRRQATQSQI